MSFSTPPLVLYTTLAPVLYLIYIYIYIYIYHGFEVYMANIRPLHLNISPRFRLGLISQGSGLIFAIYIHQEDMVRIIYSVTSNMPNSCHVRSHCVHLSVFLGIILRFISSTLGDVVNFNRKADMVATLFFLDNESLFLFGPFSCNPDGNAHARYDAIVTWR